MDNKRKWEDFNRTIDPISDIDKLKNNDLYLKELLENTDLENIKNRVDTIDEEIDGIGKRFDKNESDIKTIENDITNISQKQQDILKDIEKLKTQKQNKLIAGENITLTNNDDNTTTISSLGSGTGAGGKVNEVQKKQVGFVKPDGSYSEIWDENIHNDEAKNINDTFNHYKETIDGNAKLIDTNTKAIEKVSKDVSDNKELIDTKAPNEIDYLAYSDDEPGSATKMSVEDVFYTTNGVSKTHKELKDLANSKATKDDLNTKADKFETIDVIFKYIDGTSETHKVIK